MALAAFVAVSVSALRRPGGPVVPPEGTDADVARPKAWLARIDRWQQRHRPLAFTVAVARKFAEDGAGYLAALVSYFAFFSLFPLLMALTAVLGMVLEGNPDLQQRITGTATAQIPIVGSQLGVGTLTGSTWAVVIGTTVALWSGLRVIDAAQTALNEVWAVPLVDRPRLARRRLKSLLLFVVVGLSLLASVVVGSLASLVSGVSGQSRIAVYVVTALLNTGVFLFAFRFLPEVRLRWSELLPGSVFAAIGWFVVSVPGALYIQRTINRSEAVYADFAGVIGLLTFFFLASQVVIVGAEINAVLARRLWPRSLLYRFGVHTEADERAYASIAAATAQIHSQQVTVSYRGDARRRRPATPG